MKTLLVLSVVVGVMGTTPSIVAQDAPAAVNADEVLEMFARVRAPEVAPKVVGHYERGPSAKFLAKAISKHANDREEAALAVVYASYESDANAGAIGDGGKAHGAYQLQYVPWDVAHDPDASTRTWLWKARHAQESCASLPADDRLAQLVSGNCGHGRVKARMRAKMAHEVAATGVSEMQQE